MTIHHKEDAEQALANALKVARAAVRLRHSINADNELNVVLPKLEEIFEAKVKRGLIPSPAQMKKALGL